MAIANTQCIFPGVVKPATIIFATANTDKSGATGTAPIAYTSPAGGAGSLVQDVRVKCPVTTVAGIVCILKLDSSGALALLLEIAVPATTSSTTAAGFDSGKIVLNEFLKPGDKIQVLTTVAQSMHASFNIGDY